MFKHNTNGSKPAINAVIPAIPNPLKAHSSYDQNKAAHSTIQKPLSITAYHGLKSLSFYSALVH
jgi:hypothetical protein